MDKKELKAIVDKNLCLFIIEKFFSPFKVEGTSVNAAQYSKASGLGKSTITKMNQGTGYEIPFNMIYLILRFEKVSLEDFFKEFESKYGKASE